MGRTRETSKEAYRKIKRNGLLSRMRFAVYRILYRHGPLTGGELDHDYFNSKGAHRRLSELERLGVVSRVGERKCRITDMRCEIWDVTSSLPNGKPAGTTPSLSIRQKAGRELRRLIKKNHLKVSDDTYAVVRWLRKT